VESFTWDAEPVERLNDLIGRQMLNGEAMTLARITLTRGALVPRHSHPNEQSRPCSRAASAFPSVTRSARSARARAC
jgi:hypothetical protein